jgi:hypothetical protein
MARIRDWSELNANARQRRREAARAHAAALNPTLNAFVEIVPPATSGVPLRGLPYAAKDLFRTRGREPSLALYLTRKCLHETPPWLHAPRPRIDDRFRRS